MSQDHSRFSELSDLVLAMVSSSSDFDLASVKISVLAGDLDLSGDGGDGDNRTPDEGRRGGRETRRDAGVMPVHEWWTTGEEGGKAEEDG